MVVSGTRTLASGQWSWSVKCEAEEIAATKKPQNKANLLLVLISGRLWLRTNQAEFEPENKPNSRPAGQWPVKCEAEEIAVIKSAKQSQFALGVNLWQIVT